MVDDSNNALQRGLENIKEPFSKFIRSQTTTSIFMLVAAVLALWWANSSYYLAYQNLLDSHLGLFLEEFRIQASLKHIMNDGLMVLFFFLIGLEIKREVLSGDLAKVKSRYMLVICAIGGMVFPALIYLIFNWSEQSALGWGVPMATDTAFALGALALVKKYIPSSLFAFVVGIAIVDDIGAILVIAIFYTENISLIFLSFSILLILSLVLANYAGIRHPLVYALFGVPATWLMYKSGIHPTFAGILIALSVPASPKASSRKLLIKAKKNIEEIQNKEKPIDALGNKKDHHKLVRVRDYAEDASTPLRRWEDALGLPVMLLILPLFALLNAGVPLNLNTVFESLQSPVAYGIILGLVFGKFIGISSACWLALHLKIGALPEGLNLQYVIGASFITGIGFTMSTFISALGFESQPDNLQIAKTAIIFASILAALIGVLMLRIISEKQ